MVKWWRRHAAAAFINFHRLLSPLAKITALPIGPTSLICGFWLARITSSAIGQFYIPPGGHRNSLLVLTGWSWFCLRTVRSFCYYTFGIWDPSAMIFEIKWSKWKGRKHMGSQVIFPGMDCPKSLIHRTKSMKPSEFTISKSAHFDLSPTCAYIFREATNWIFPKKSHNWGPILLR